MARLSLRRAWKLRDGQQNPEGGQCAADFHGDPRRDPARPRPPQAAPSTTSPWPCSSRLEPAHHAGTTQNQESYVNFSGARGAPQAIVLACCCAAVTPGHAASDGPGITQSLWSTAVLSRMPPRVPSPAGPLTLHWPMDDSASSFQLKHLKNFYNLCSHRSGMALLLRTLAVMTQLYKFVRQDFSPFFFFFNVSSKY